MTIDDKRRQKSEEITVLKQPLLNDQASSSVKRTKFTSPNPHTKDSNYSRTHQNSVTNKLLITTDKVGIRHDTRMNIGIITATNGKTDLDVILKQFNTNTHISQNTMKVLAIMMQQFTQGQHGIISIRVEELAGYLGKKNIKKAREAIKGELDNIRNMNLKVDGKFYISADLCQTAIIRNGTVYFEFNNVFKEYLLKGNLMPINMKLFSITSNPQNNQYVWCIGWKIHVQAKLNQYKEKNKNHIFRMSVKTLLETCYGSGMPSYEEVMSKTRHVGRFIIDPIECALNTLSYEGIIGDWSYELKGGGINDYDEVLNEDNPKDNYSIAKDKRYNEWANQYVLITMPTNYIEEIAPYSKKKAAAQVKLTPNRRKYAK